MKTNLQMFLAASFLCLTTALAAATDLYFFTDLGKINSTDAHVRINDRGTVVVDQGGPSLVFDEGTVYDLSQIVGSDFQSTDINNDGIIVGWLFKSPENEWHAASLLKSKPTDRFGTNLMDLGFVTKYPGRPSGSVTINDNGQIAVCCRTNEPRAFTILFDGSGKAWLPTGFQPERIGRDATIAGKQSVPPPEFGVFYAALITPVGEIILPRLPNLDPKVSSTALDFAATPQRLITIGSTGTGGRFDHAFEWLFATTELVDLDVLPHPEWEGSTAALAINSRGEMVGTVGDQFLHAAMFRNGRVIDLNQSFSGGILIRGMFGYTVQTADSINEAGQIAGWCNSTKYPFQDSVRAYVMSPIRTTIRLDGDQVTITWPDVLAGFDLQVSDNVGGTSAWKKSPIPPQHEGNQWIVRTETKGASQYFQLVER